MYGMQYLLYVCFKDCLFVGKELNCYVAMYILCETIVSSLQFIYVRKVS